VSDTERSLVLVKPDGVRRALIGEVISRIEAKGLTLVALQLRVLDRETAAAHYAEHEGKPFFTALLEFITAKEISISAFKYELAEATAAASAT